MSVVSLIEIHILITRQHIAIINQSASLPSCELSIVINIVPDTNANKIENPTNNCYHNYSLIYNVQYNISSIILVFLI